MRGKECSTYYFACFVGITPACAGKRFFSGLVSRVPWDHPRMCGEKLAFFVFCPYVLGSPPHVRGKALFIKNHFPFVGITPACAGKRCTCCYACPRPTDHPRTCGEKFDSRCPLVRRLGSPPHMRGKVGHTVTPPFRKRITPAHAGKSGASLSQPLSNADHPRTCGEKTFCDDAPFLILGSPPHMRGKEIWHNLAPAQIGITPAHAGKSVEKAKEQAENQDHPRTCGEKVQTLLYTDVQKGSPPHMRGKAIQSRPDDSDNGITPAHAGKSSVLLKFIAVALDHPRTCGEKSAAVPMQIYIYGSPPHMRGKGSFGHCLASSSRITPAHAGKSIWCRLCFCAVKDHPRTCGEKTKKIP